MKMRHAWPLPGSAGVQTGVDAAAAGVHTGRPRAAPKSGAPGGFTLIEALIAIALVAAVLPVALAGVSRAGEAASTGHRREVALHLAQNKLNEWVASGDWANGATSGDFDAVADGDEATGFHWQLESTPWRDPAVHALRVTVGWGTPATPGHQVALDTWVVEATTPTTTGDISTGGAP